MYQARPEFCNLLFVVWGRLLSSLLALRTGADSSERPCPWAQAAPLAPRSRRSCDWSKGSSQCAEAATEQCHSSLGMWNRNRTWVVVGGLMSVPQDPQAIEYNTRYMYNVLELLLDKRID